MDHFQFVVSEHRRAVESLFAIKDDLQELGHLLVERLRAGNKLLICGNGGSAADAQHIAAEMVNRFRTDRPALPAIALTTDSSAMTSIGNDFGWEKVFARQIEALARPGDLLLVITTSGNSPSVLSATEVALRLGCKVACFSGKNGGMMARRFPPPEVLELRVGHEDTARIQECHILMGHYLCETVDRAWERRA